MKLEFVTKDEFNYRFNSLEGKFDKLATAVDKVMAELLSFRQEMTSLTHNITTIKTWMAPVSKKTGVDYPF